ncbi:MAG: pyridoxal-phosphate dependent enzyme [Acidilobus sp.]
MWRLFCPSCGFRGEEGKYYPFCPVCRGALELEGEPPAFRPLLGEGRTPLVLRRTRVGELRFKLEYVNPTGSFKDRGVSPSVQLAKELGYRCVVEDSSGNAGISTAAFAAYLGLEARIAVPSTAPPGKRELLRALGASVVELPSREEAMRYAEAMSSTCFYVSHSRSAVFLEGMKSVGSELPDDVKSVIVPSASFSLLLGIWRGSRRRPRLFAVQGTSNPTLSKYLRPLAVGATNESKLADGLVLREAPRARQAAEAVRESGGGLVLVSDKEIAAATKELWSMGFMVEPTSATAYAAASLLHENGFDLDGAVLLLTGSGLKMYDLISRLVSTSSSAPERRPQHTP